MNRIGFSANNTQSAAFHAGRFLSPFKNLPVPVRLLASGVKDQEVLSGQLAACAVEKTRSRSELRTHKSHAPGGGFVCRWEGDYSPQNTSWTAAVRKSV